MFVIKTKIATVLISVSFIYSILIPQPGGTSFSSEAYNAKKGDVEFLYDITLEKDGKRQVSQRIFERAHEIIENAQEFIIMDMFLFNDEYDRSQSYPGVSRELSQKLIEKKKADPEIEIVVITDEINTFYGSYDSNIMEDLKSEGIEVVFTRMEKLRDSNPLYSGFWRLFLNWRKEGGKGWITNPFSSDSPKVTLSSYMRLLNFKANHRKVLASDKEALVSSANAHDASAFHSNIAFSVKGDIVADIVDAEKVVALWSGVDIGFGYERENKEVDSENVKIQYITEGRIGEQITREIKNTKRGDFIDMAMFYLSDRKIIKEIIDASNRGVNVNLILDANKDAFGREKNGIPNRVVAHEIFKRTGEKASIRWYNTKGEQFHTKLISIRSGGKSIIFGGSANITRRNVRGYNLESDIKITALENSDISIQIREYFEMLNDEDKLLSYDEYVQDSFLKKVIYRFQEFSGISTF